MRNIKVGEDLTYRLKRDVADDDFLFTLYCSTRAEEITSWGWTPAQVDIFLRMQYFGQQQSYATMPDAEHRIICQSGVPIGRMIVDWREATLHLADISLVSESRGRGLGTQLMQALKEEALASQRRITLNVRRDNPAVCLYRRLGFTCFGESEVYASMVWQSPVPEFSLSSK